MCTPFDIYCICNTRFYPCIPLAIFRYIELHCLSILLVLLAPTYSSLGFYEDAGLEHLDRAKMVRPQYGPTCTSPRQTRKDKCELSHTEGEAKFSWLRDYSGQSECQPTTNKSAKRAALLFAFQYETPSVAEETRPDDVIPGAPLAY
jgi:hypothetical protein